MDDVLQEPPYKQADGAGSRTAEKALPVDPSRGPAVVPEAESNEAETVTERYPDGSVKIERHVVLDPNGNYVNHGPYTMYDQRGKILRTGQYRDGKQHGAWTRLFNADDGYLLSAKDAKAFRGPFVSRASFADGRLIEAHDYSLEGSQPAKADATNLTSD